MTSHLLWKKVEKPSKTNTSPLPTPTGKTSKPNTRKPIMDSSKAPKKPPQTNAWYVLAFEERGELTPNEPARKGEYPKKDILILVNKGKPILDTCKELESTLYERFNRMAMFMDGDSFRIKRLAVITEYGRSVLANQSLDITTEQLITYLRDDLPIPTEKGVVKPNLFGLSSNKVIVEFENVEFENVELRGERGLIIGKTKV